MTTQGNLTLKNRWDHILARVGYRRGRHRVEPGLYRIGEPGAEAPVFVSANYSMSFDALRSSLDEIAAFILVLDTDGVNVWCAAGKGTFGTDELVRRIEETGLADVVAHKRLIVPQLGAPGVSAHEVRRQSEFHVEFGPVRASDIREYLETGKTTEEMRTVRFRTGSRAAVIPIEVVHLLLPVLAVTLVLRLIGIFDHFYNEAIAGVVAGVVIVPILLPWIPTADFSSKGAIAGALLAVPIMIGQIRVSDVSWWHGAGAAAGALLLSAAIGAFLSLNFTGSTTHTSRTGVRREMNRYIPAMAWMAVTGLILRIVFALI